MASGCYPWRQGTCRRSPRIRKDYAAENGAVGKTEFVPSANTIHRWNLCGSETPPGPGPSLNFVHQPSADTEFSFKLRLKGMGPKSRCTNGTLAARVAGTMGSPTQRRFR